MRRMKRKAWRENGKMLEERRLAKVKEPLLAVSQRQQRQSSGHDGVSGEQKGWEERTNGEERIHRLVSEMSYMLLRRNLMDPSYVLNMMWRRGRRAKDRAIMHSTSHVSYTWWGDGRCLEGCIGWNQMVRKAFCYTGVKCINPATSQGGTRKEHWLLMSHSGKKAETLEL